MERLSKELVEAIREDGKVVAVDEKGIIVDLAFYNKEENEITFLGSSPNAKWMTVHGYAMKYIFTKN